METEGNSRAPGFCANCQLPFSKECSKVRRIIIPPEEPNDSSGEEEIISIREALSVVFEIPPLTQSKKEHLLRNSVFKLHGGTGDEGDQLLTLCINCSEALKSLYIGFQSFTKACGRGSEIGKMLRKLHKDEEANEGTSQEDCCSSVMVKMEPGSEDEGSIDRSDFEEVEREYIGGLAENVVKQAPESDLDDPLGGEPWSPDNGLLEENDHRPQKDQLNTTRRLRNRDIKVSYNDDSDSIDEDDSENEGRTRDFLEMSSSHHNGNRKDHSYINQLKCPVCSKLFLHESTLICHRQIIHGEKIMIRPPPLPQMHYARKLNSKNLKVFAETNEKSSTCPICRMEVPRTDIRCHLATHTRSPSNPWLCIICGRNFSGQQSLQNHAQVHLNEMCKGCGKKIPILNRLRHIGKCTGIHTCNKRPKHHCNCRVCGKSFPSYNQLDQHRARAHGRCWNCKLCGIKFKEYKAMENHMKTHRQKKSHKCKICDKCFDRIDVLRLHIKRFHKNNEGSLPTERNNTWETEVDGAFVNKINRTTTQTSEGTSKASLDKAMTDSVEQIDTVIPVVENRFTCTGCGMAFPREPELDDHLMAAHTQSENNSSFLCKICNRQLPDSFCLKLHVKTHGEMKPLHCLYPNCPKTYRDKNTFFYHLKEKHGMDSKIIVAKYPDLFRHHQNRDYAARVGKKRQTQTITPIKGKFPCETCGRAFPTIYAVRNHVKLVHDKVKDFLCKYCGKAFARKSYFLLHEKLHTSNEAPYKCHLCGKGFRLPGNLRMHLKSTIHNPNKDFVCDICGKGFNRSDNLRLHVKTVHLKMPSNRKPKLDLSSRQDHRGGRHRIYVGAETSDMGNSNLSAADINCSQHSSGTSQSTLSTAHCQSSSVPNVPVFSRQLSLFDTSSHAPSLMGKHSSSPQQYTSGDYIGSNLSSLTPVGLPLVSQVPVIRHSESAGSESSSVQSFTQAELEYHIRGIQHRRNQ